MSLKHGGVNCSNKRLETTYVSTGKENCFLLDSQHLRHSHDLESALTPQVKGAVPQDHPPLQRQSQVWLLILLTNWLHIRGSHDPSLRFDNLLEQLPEHRKALFLLLTVFYKGCNSEQPDGRGMRPGTWGGVCSFHALCGCISLPRP